MSCNQVSSVKHLAISHKYLVIEIEARLEVLST